MNRSILLVEDNDGDAFLIRKALKEMDAPVELHWVPDVDLALRFLAKTDGFEEAVSPELVVLDVNLPPKTGYDVLEVIRERLAHIPVVMLSSANSARDRAKSLALGAVAHYGKPSSFAQYRPLLESIIKLIDAPRHDPPVQAYRTWHNRVVLAQ
jgi:CheY-like chemotaxis protein